MLSFAALTGGDDFSDIDDRDGAPFPTEGQGRGGGTRGARRRGYQIHTSLRASAPFSPGEGGRATPGL